MKRLDSIGLFWQDLIKEKVVKEAKPKRTPPPRTWEEPDYLPNLEEATVFDCSLYEDMELAADAGSEMVFDIEIYPNYLLVAFMCLKNNKVVYFDTREGINYPKLVWVVHNFILIGFNSKTFDIPILSMVVARKSVEDIYTAAMRIILQNDRDYLVLKNYKVKRLRDIDHIDLIEVAPLRASLKIYAGRLHAQRMQDLPFIPSTVLSDPQITIVRWYCVNDLKNTALLYKELKQQIDLRRTMSGEYEIDLRSHSDAQISEAVLCHELERLNGFPPRRPELHPGSAFYYQMPRFIQYRSETLQWVYNLIATTPFFIRFDGTVGLPDALADLKIPIAGCVFRMGIGGLHSSEKKMSVKADENHVVVDRDVASYYPAIILNLGLFPQHLGPNFLRVYQTLVNRRLAAKNAGDKVVADSLKITINGSFGKLGSPYSTLYSPHLLIQVTITGQLSLLMLIERIEWVGIQVVSANTDGVVIKCPVGRRKELEQIISQWERDTGFQTEETEYAAIFCRDVNNYIAVKKDKSSKVKGAYAEKGSSGNTRLSKNPSGLISIDAVIAFLTKDRPITATIRECRDITRFVCVRTVQGGAVKDGEYLGKAIRWYYATGVSGEIIYAKNGNKVPRSDGAKPLMGLSKDFPEDVDYDWYEREAEKILKEIGYYGNSVVEEEENEHED